MDRQVVLLSSPSESAVTAWDLHTGTLLTSYKGNATPRNGMCCLGADYFAAVQNNKDTVLFWTWHKDQVVQRSFAQEKLTALAASTCGALLAGGGASGTVYMWETASGRLLRSWPAHYKAVTCLAFTCSASLLVSGSEDTLVSSWLLHDLLDASQDLGSPADSRPLPLHSWSSHSLPVTALALGAAGHEAAGLVASASLDRSVKLHRLSDGALLATVALPVAATAVVVDAGEHALYVGGADGSVYEVSLVGEVADLQQQQPNGTGGSQLGAQRPSWLQAGGAGLGESGALLHPHARMAAHSREVTALAMSLDGELLVSGSEDGSAVVWDLRSRQPLHTLTTPFKLPVSCALLLPQPSHLASGGSAGGGAAHGGSAAAHGADSGGGSGRKGPRRLAPLAPLVKYSGMQGCCRAWESAPVVLAAASEQGLVLGASMAARGLANGVWAGGGGGQLEGQVCRVLEAGHGQQGLGAEARSDAETSQVGTARKRGPGGELLAIGKRSGGEVKEGQETGGEVEVVRQLRAELAAAQAKAAEWQALHAQLHAYCVDKVMSPNV
ncbi:hypothetical protein QJQ45_014184 [Haematococcus lacustris]|nr:hypothetical protein QJQ45_014184 [Haematococcus lacustris]